MSFFYEDGETPEVEEAWPEISDVTIENCGDFGQELRVDMLHTTTGCGGIQHVLSPIPDLLEAEDVDVFVILKKREEVVDSRASAPGVKGDDLHIHSLPWHRRFSLIHRRGLFNIRRLYRLFVTC